MRRRAILAFLLGIPIILSYAYVYRTWQAHGSDIVIQLAEYADAIALPYRLARLSSEPAPQSLLLPVSGVRMLQVADTWGEARSEGRNHEGTDIFAGRGTPVYAAARGFVLRAGENRLGGTIVFTAGAGGIGYYYAHLDRIADGIRVGASVTTDTVLGYVGNTGNAAGTPPHLHFGMYTREGPANPYPLLVDR